MTGSAVSGTTVAPDRNDRVASVLARAAALSDELRGTIRELEEILRSGDEEPVANVR